ncbi:histidinol phosphate phosphatase domain-containing protein [Desulfothermus okinawensis JCM 13304]
MIDLHTHTVFSDGELIPAELIQRAKTAGYKAIAITDHVDHTNIEHILKMELEGIKQLKVASSLDVLVGVEITHVPPPLIPELIERARKLGAQIVVVHGETIVEPVEKGTNLAAIQGRADILAHPGLISEEEVKLAAELGIYLEITTRSGHSLTNGHVARMAKEHGARLVINNDAHSPKDLIFVEKRRLIAMGAGVTYSDYLEMENNSQSILKNILNR